MNTNALQSILGGVVALTMGASASAQMLGNDITADWRIPDFNSVIESHVVNVVDTVELTSDIIRNDSKYEIDLGDDWVEFRFNATSNWSDRNFNGWSFVDTNATIPEFIGFSVESFSNGIGNLDGMATGFAADLFWVNLHGVTAVGGGEWIRFKVELASSACLELTVSTLTAGQAATWDITGATPNAEVAIVYGFSPGQTILNGFAGYCADFGIAGVTTSRIICRKQADGVGDLSCKQTLPANIGGLRILSQAAERGTCPDPCMSDVDEQIVQ